MVRIKQKEEHNPLEDPGARLEEDVQPEDKLQDVDLPDACELAHAGVACRSRVALRCRAASCVACAPSHAWHSSTRSEAAHGE